MKGEKFYSNLYTECLKLLSKFYKLAVKLLTFPEIMKKSINFAFQVRFTKKTNKTCDL